MGKRDEKNIREVAIMVMLDDRRVEGMGRINSNVSKISAIEKCCQYYCTGDPPLSKSM
jgi:hypothetical protein